MAARKSTSTLKTINHKHLDHASIASGMKCIPAADPKAWRLLVFLLGLGALSAGKRNAGKMSRRFFFCYWPPFPIFKIRTEILVAKSPTSP
jgi:hypothetical protein